MQNQSGYTSQLHVRRLSLHRQIKNYVFRLQARAHSAHIGQEVEVHYRRHPLYGHRVKVRDVEQRSGGSVVHVEAAPGVVRVVEAWMLDRAVCSAMELGEPRITVAALCDLHRLLVDRRLRAHSPNGSNIVREKRNGEAAKGRSNTNAIASDDAAPDEHEVRAELQGMSTEQRARAITRLASLLIHAAGGTTGKECDDDER